MSFTKKEGEALKLTTQLFNKLLEVNNEENLNDDIINDFRYHIHAIQNSLLARPKIKEINK